MPIVKPIGFSKDLINAIQAAVLYFGSQQACDPRTRSHQDSTYEEWLKPYIRRKKVCRFCVEKIDDINYKDVRMLQSFIAERGKIVPRRISGVCAPHQRRLTDAILKARNIALLPFAAAV